MKKETIKIKSILKWNIKNKEYKNTYIKKYELNENEIKELIKNLKKNKENNELVKQEIYIKRSDKKWKEI